MKNNCDFNPLDYIDPQYLLPKDCSEEEKTAYLEEMGFTTTLSRFNEPKLEYDCNQFGLYLDKCIKSKDNKKGILYIYNRKGIYEEFDKFLMGKIVKFLMGQCGHFWKEDRESAGLAAYQRDIYKGVPPLATENFLNLANGILNLDTLQLTPHSPDYFFTVQIPIDYDPNAKCPRFEKFLHEITGVDKEIIAVLQEWLGYCLSNSTQAEKLAFFYGQGSNGKSVFAKVMVILIGKENCSAVSLSDFNSPFGLEPLINSKLNLASENEISGKLGSEKLKAVVSGDEINIQRKHKLSVTIRPSTKITMLMNNLPAVSDVSYGFFRRILLIPFNQTFTEETRDVDLFNKLMEEMPGILNFAIAGLVRLQSNQYNFSKSQVMEEVLRQYQGTQNPTADFFKDTYVQSDDSSISRSSLYNDYIAYCDNKGYERLSRADFWKRLKIAANDPKNEIQLAFKEVRGKEFLKNYKKKYPDNDLFQL